MSEEITPGLAPAQKPKAKKAAVTNSEKPEDDQSDMAAPKGNKFWQARSRHGRKPIFATPDDIWGAAAEYFDWIEANPLFEDKLVTFQGSASHEPVAKMRAMTITGLCIFLDISMQAWTEYCVRDGFGDITARIAEIIRTQKFTGAAADLLNANIIAREIGLADKTEISGPDGGPVQVEPVKRPRLSREEWLASYVGAIPPALAAVPAKGGK